VDFTSIYSVTETSLLADTVKQQRLQCRVSRSFKTTLAAIKISHTINFTICYLYMLIISLTLSGHKTNSTGFSFRVF